MLPLFVVAVPPDTLAEPAVTFAVPPVVAAPEVVVTSSCSIDCSAS